MDRLYIHPKSLVKRKRIYLPAIKRYGAKIRVHVLGRHRSDSNLVRASIEVVGDKGLIKAIRRLGIKLTKKPAPAYFSIRVLAEISHTIKEPYPIGIGELGEIVNVDVSLPIATDNIAYALAIAGEPVLWVDYMGDQTPLQCGFVEYDGFPVPKSPRKIHEIADVLARLLRVKKDNVMASLSGEREHIMGDVELKIVDPLDDLRKWRILTDSSGSLGVRSYIDFSGLPSTLQQISLAIATGMWDGWIIIHTPRAWGWIEDSVKYRSRTLVVCGTAQGFNFPNIILGDKLVKKIRFLDRIVIVEKPFEPFWRLG